MYVVHTITDVLGYSEVVPEFSIELSFCLFIPHLILNGKPCPVHFERVVRLALRVFYCVRKLAFKLCRSMAKADAMVRGGARTILVLVVGIDLDLVLRGTCTSPGSMFLHIFDTIQNSDSMKFYSRTGKMLMIQI